MSLSDASQLDTESGGSTIATVTENVEELTIPGLDASFTIGPSQVFETPQRVWLPLSPGTDPNAAQLYYYHPNGPGQGWYLAEGVEGWLVPDSSLLLEIDGTTYLGFLVRHAGIVQVGIPIDDTP